MSEAVSRRKFMEVAAAAPCAIKIEIGKGIEVAVTVPSIRKADLINILAVFFAEGSDGKNTEPIKKQAFDELTKVLTKASVVRVILTSSCPA